MVQKGWKVRFDGDVCMVRKSPAGEVERVAICRGRSLTLGKILVNLTKGSGFVEIEFSKDGARIVSGDPADVADIVRSGTSILKR